MGKARARRRAQGARGPKRAIRGCDYQFRPTGFKDDATIITARGDPRSWEVYYRWGFRPVLDA